MSLKNFLRSSYFVYVSEREYMISSENDEAQSKEKAKEKVVVVEKEPFPRSEDGLPLEAWLIDGTLIEPQSK